MMLKTIRNSFVYFIIGWLYYIFGLLLSFVIENFVFFQVVPLDADDSKIFFSTFLRISIIIICLVTTWNLTRAFKAHEFVPFALIVVACMIMVPNLNTNTAYLINKYIGGKEYSKKYLKRAVLKNIDDQS